MTSFSTVVWFHKKVMVTMDPRLAAYFYFTTINSFLDVACFEDWSVLFFGSVLWRIVAILVFLTTNTWGASSSSSTLSPTIAKILFIAPFWAEAYYWFGKMPFTWESNLWSLQSDLVVSFWVLQYGLEDDNNNEVLAETTQEMYSFYYTAAGFWKINSHFLNPTSSCATVFFCQHIATVVGSWMHWERQVAMAQFMAPYAPVGTILVELSMGLVLAMGRWASPVTTTTRRQWTKRGMLVILYFHLAVCVTPPPNNISLCASRLVILMDPTAIRRVAVRVWDYRMPLTALQMLVLAFGIQHSWTPLNWSFKDYIPVMIFIQMTLVEEEKEATITMEMKSVPNKSSTRRPLWTRVASGLALFYSFGTIMLGCMEEGSNNMFSNLKIHGGTSNHLLLPTGLLFHWFRDAGDAHPYGGGEIRIEETDSNWLQLIYPNDLTHILQPPGASELLEVAVGAAKPNFFNAGANRVLGLRERGWIPPPPHGKFLQYSVPSLEWKRLLKEAIQKDGSFSVTYSHLPGSHGDEVWRGTAWERRVTLRIHEGQLSSCLVQYYDAIPTEPMDCPKSDLPYHLDSVPWWAEKIGLYHGYPILHNADGTIRTTIQCFGP